MTLPELLELLKKSPELAAELAAAGVAFSFAVGAFGTAVETAGSKLGMLWLEKLGQRIEAVGSEFPKLMRGSRYTADLEARIEAGLKRTSAQ